MVMITPKLNKEEAHLLVEEMSAWVPEIEVQAKKHMPEWSIMILCGFGAVTVGMLLGVFIN